MIRQLSRDEIVGLINMTPEQAVYDWKRDFTLPNDDEKRGEIIKDITAIANSITLLPGFIIYGVEPRRPDPIVGISNTYDDAKLQDLLKGKIKPAVDFVYYEASFDAKVIGVLQVNPMQQRPHIISVDIGKIRNGQIPIRRGSSTQGVTREDLIDMFYGETSEGRRRKLQQLYREVDHIQNDALRLNISEEQIETRVSTITFDLNVLESLLGDPFCLIAQEAEFTRELEWLRQQCKAVNNNFKQYQQDSLPPITPDELRNAKKRHNRQAKIICSQMQDYCTRILRVLRPLIDL